MRKSTASHIKAFMQRKFSSDIFRYIGFPLTLIFDRKHKDQVFSTIRNIEIVAEGIIDSLPHFPKLWKLGSIPLEFVYNYTKTQSSVSKRRQYNIYTETDKKVPFKPEYDTIYVYMFTQLPYIFSRIAPHLNEDVIAKIIAATKDISDISSYVYNNYPSFIPKIESKDRILHKAVLSIDDQSNACPSLHVAYSYFVANICAYLNMQEHDPIAWGSIEKTSKAMVYTVQYTKRHGLIDVSAGELLTEMVFMKHFKCLPFRLDRHYNEMIKDHPLIPFEEIKNRKDDLLNIYTTVENLGEAIGNYISNNYILEKRNLA